MARRCWSKLAGVVLYIIERDLEFVDVAVDPFPVVTGTDNLRGLGTLGFRRGGHGRRSNGRRGGSRACLALGIRISSSKFLHLSLESPNSRDHARHLLTYVRIDSIEMGVKVVEAFGKHDAENLHISNQLVEGRSSGRA